MNHRHEAVEMLKKYVWEELLLRYSTLTDNMLEGIKFCLCRGGRPTRCRTCTSRQVLLPKDISFNLSPRLVRAFVVSQYKESCKKGAKP